MRQHKELIGVRVTPKVKRWLEKQSSDRGLSIAELIRWLIASYMESEGCFKPAQEFQDYTPKLENGEKDEVRE